MGRGGRSASQSEPKHTTVVSVWKYNYICILLDGNDIAGRTFITKFPNLVNMKILSITALEQRYHFVLKLSYVSRRGGMKRKPVNACLKSKC